MKMSMPKEEIERQLAITARTTALQNAFTDFHKTGIKYTGTDAEVLEKFKATGREIFVEDGIAFTNYDSEILKVEEALLRHAFDAPQGEVDRRTLPRGASTARPNVRSRAEMTTREKVDYVNEHGEEAFLKLPSKPVTSSEVKTTEDFRRLPRAEKVRRINEDPDAIRKLAPAPTLRQNGTYINHEAIARQRAIRPASRKG
jgi:hypothetical protein